MQKFLAMHGFFAMLCNALIISNNDFCVFQSFGSCNRTTTAYRTETDIRVQCGYFDGNIEEF